MFIRKLHVSLLLIVVSVGWLSLSMAKHAHAQTATIDMLSANFNEYLYGLHHGAAYAPNYSLGISWRVAASSTTTLTNPISQTHIIQLKHEDTRDFQTIDSVDCAIPRPDQFCLERDEIFITSQSTSYSMTMRVSLDDSPIDELYRFDTVLGEIWQSIRERGIPSVRVVTVDSAGQLSSSEPISLHVVTGNEYIVDSLTGEHDPNIGVVLRYQFQNRPIDPRIAIRKLSPEAFANSSQFSPTQTPDFNWFDDAGEYSGQTMNMLVEDLFAEGATIYTADYFDSPNRQKQMFDLDVMAGETIYYQLGLIKSQRGVILLPPFHHFEPLDTISITIPLTATEIVPFSLVDGSFQVVEDGDEYVVSWETTAEPHINSFTVEQDISYPLDSVSISATGSATTGGNYTVRVLKNESTTRLNLYAGDDALDDFRLIAIASIPQTPLAIQAHTISTSQIAPYLLWSIALFCLIGTAVICGISRFYRLNERRSFGGASFVKAYVVMWFNGRV